METSRMGMENCHGAERLCLPLPDRLWMVNYTPIAAGWNQLERRTKHLHLRLVVEGTVAYESDHHAVREYGPGHVFCHLPGVRHSMWLIGGAGLLSSIHWTRLGSDPDDATGGDLHLQPQEVVSVGDGRRVTDLFRTCAQLFQNPDPLQQARLIHTARLALLTVAEDWDAGDQARIDPRVVEACTYLRQNAACPIGRDGLARLMQVTPQHVNLLFRKHLNTTPTAYLRRIRCQRAWDMLEHDGCTVQEAAAAVGYDDPYYFSRAFKQVFGESPSAVKEKRPGDSGTQTRR